MRENPAAQLTPSELTAHALHAIRCMHERDVTEKSESVLACLASCDRARCACERLVKLVHQVHAVPRERDLVHCVSFPLEEVDQIILEQYDRPPQAQIRGERRRSADPSRFAAILEREQPPVNGRL